MEEQRADVLAMVTGVLARYAEPEAAGLLAAEPDTPLAELGLSSLRVVEVLLDLEAEIGVEIPPDAITAETFRTPATIADAVRPWWRPRPS